jgi:tetratricopeptide (TPR) repeat protein
MANIYVTKHDFDRALTLFADGLIILDQLGDKKEKARLLSQMSNVYWEKKEYDQAQLLVERSIELGRQIGSLESVAYNTLKMGQLSQVRGDETNALSCFRESLALFERLGARPMVVEIHKMIAEIEDDTVVTDDPLTQAVAQARSAAARGDIPSAIQYQEQAVELIRGAGQEREALIRLSVMLYNLAGFYLDAERHENAVNALEEVVAIDEQTGHQDLESDRRTLEAARRIASMSPEERAERQKQAQEAQESNRESDDFESQLQARLAQLPPEQRAQAEAQIRGAFEEFQRMTPEQQAAVMDQNRRAQIDHAANQARDAALAYFRKQAPRKDILDYLTELAQKAREGEQPGSPWLEVAALCNSLIALIKQEHVPPVPAKYAAHFSAVQQEIKP